MKLKLQLCYKFIIRTGGAILIKWFMNIDVQKRDDAGINVKIRDRGISVKGIFRNIIDAGINRYEEGNTSGCIWQVL